MVNILPTERLLQERIRRNRSHQTFNDLLEENVDYSPHDGLSDEGLEEGGTGTGPSISERLVVMADRLPVTCTRDTTGNRKLQVG
jgi:hypothetical protein